MTSASVALPRTYDDPRKSKSCEERVVPQRRQLEESVVMGGVGADEVEDLDAEMRAAVRARSASRLDEEGVRREVAPSAQQRER